MVIFRKSVMVLMSLIFIVMLPLQAFASVSLLLKYDPIKDNYMVAYYKQLPDRPSSFVVKFTNPSNTAANAQKTFYGADVTGVFYLTCNGTYVFDFYDSGGVLVNSSQSMLTTQVQNALCESYPQPTDQYGPNVAKPVNDLNLRINREQLPTNPDSLVMRWDQIPNCGFVDSVYKFYLDGNLIHTEYGSDSYLSWDITPYPTGYWRVEGGYENNACQSGYVSEKPYSPANATTGNLSDPWGGVPASGDGSNPNGPVIPATPPDPNAPVTNEGLDEALNNCANLICECISALQPSLDQIKKNTGDLIPMVTELINGVKDVKDSVDAVKDQLVTDQTYPIDTVESKNIPSLEDNKPPMIEEPFIDSTTYFEDQGDDTTPLALPQAPEPAEFWKDKDGNQIAKQPKLEKSPVLERAPTLTKDAPKIREQPKVREPVKTRDPVMIQDKTDYRQQLRWKSETYVD